MGSTISYYFHSVSFQSLIDYMNSYDTINYYENNSHDNSHDNSHNLNDDNNRYNVNYSHNLNNSHNVNDDNNRFNVNYNVHQAIYNQVSVDDFYKLYIYVHDFPGMENIKQNYQINAFKHNSVVENYLRCLDGCDNRTNDGVYDSDAVYDGDGAVVCYDSGFDLLCPENIIWTEEFPIYMLDHKISCAMTFNNKHVGYYLYLRSSTPIKTPLRLANSVGIIDSGYRGTIKAIFDILPSVSDSFTFFQNNRYVQLAPPNIGCPMKVFIVDDLSMLGKKNNRNENGFGSSGN